MVFLSHMTLYTSSGMFEDASHVRIPEGATLVEEVRTISSAALLQDLRENLLMLISDNSIVYRVAQGMPNRFLADYSVANAEELAGRQVTVVSLDRPFKRDYVGLIPQP